MLISLEHVKIFAFELYIYPEYQKKVLSQTSLYHSLCLKLSLLFG